MHYSWPFIKIITDKLVENGQFKNKLEIELALLDKAWSKEWKLKLWHNSQAKTLEKEIKSYTVKYKNNEKIKLTAYYYSHLPHTHGMCINDEILFVSDSYWKKTKEKDDRMPALVLGESEYIRYDVPDKTTGKARITQFNHLFDFLKLKSKEV